MLQLTFDQIATLNISQYSKYMLGMRYNAVKQSDMFFGVKETEIKTVNENAYTLLCMFKV